MLLSAVSVLVVAQSSSEIPEGLMTNPVYIMIHVCRLVRGVTRIQNHNKLKGQFLAVGRYEAYTSVCL